MDKDWKFDVISLQGRNAKRSAHTHVRTLRINRWCESDQKKPTDSCSPQYEDEHDDKVDVNDDDWCLRDFVGAQTCMNGAFLPNVLPLLSLLWLTIKISVANILSIHWHKHNDDNHVFTASLGRANSHSNQMHCATLFIGHSASFYDYLPFSTICYYIIVIVVVITLESDESHVNILFLLLLCASHGCRGRVVVFMLLCDANFVRLKSDERHHVIQSLNSQSFRLLWLFIWSAWSIAARGTRWNCIVLCIFVIFFHFEGLIGLSILLSPPIRALIAAQRQWQTLAFLFEIRSPIYFFSFPLISSLLPVDLRHSFGIKMDQIDWYLRI